MTPGKLPIVTRGGGGGSTAANGTLIDSLATRGTPGASPGSGGGPSTTGGASPGSVISMSGSSPGSGGPTLDLTSPSPSKLLGTSSSSVDKRKDGSDFTGTGNKAAANAAIRAVKDAEPIPLPASKFNEWRTLTFRFDPATMFGGY